MSDSSISSIKPDFLTPSREDAIQRAFVQARYDFQEFGSLYPEIMRTLSSSEKAFLRRLFLCTNLRNYLKDTEGIEFREDKGIFMIEFDDKYVVHIKKLDEYSLLGRIPKTLFQARNAPIQLPLFEFEDDLTPLHELADVIGGYCLDESGLISGFYLNDQENDEILLNQYEIDVNSIANDIEPDITHSLKPKLTIKPENTNQQRKVDGE